MDDAVFYSNFFQQHWKSSLVVSMKISLIYFMFSVSLNDSRISISNSSRRSLIGILLWSMFQTISLYSTSSYLDLLPGLTKKDPYVSLNVLVRISVILCSEVSLVSNLYQLHTSSLYAKSGRRSQASISTGTMIALYASVFDNLILLTESLLR